MTDSNQGMPPLLEALRSLIVQARQKILRTVDATQVHTYWHIGRHIVEFEQGGEIRAEYGVKLLPRLAEKLTEEFGRGFDASNLHKMKQFYLSFSILDALRPELSWTHYHLLLRVDRLENWSATATRSKPAVIWT